MPKAHCLKQIPTLDFNSTPKTYNALPKPPNFDNQKTANGGQQRNPNPSSFEVVPTEEGSLALPDIQTLLIWDT